MGSLNKVMLIGNLGRDPEIRYTQSGNAVASFTLATTDTWNDQQGQRQERTEWHNIVAWNRLADLAQNYLKQGKQIYVEGRLQTRSWEDAQSGQKRYKTEIEAKVIQFLDRRSDGDSNYSSGGNNYRQAPQNQPQGGRPPAPQQPQYQPPSANTQQPYAPPPPNTQSNVQEPPPGDAYIEDDIPF